MAVSDSSCRLEVVSLCVQISATWCNCPLWDSRVRGQSSLPSLSLLSHLYLGGSWVIPASSLYPLLPPQPLLEPRKKPSAELAFSRFFFFNTNFPLFQGNLQSGLVCAWFGERLVLCFMLPEERLSTCFSFWFDSLPLCRGVRGYSCCCQLQMGTPLFKNLHVNPLVGEKTAERKSQTKQKKIKTTVNKVFFFVLFVFFPWVTVRSHGFAEGWA